MHYAHPLWVMPLLLILIRLLPFVPATIHSLLLLSSTRCHFNVSILSQKKQPQKTTLLEKKKKMPFEFLYALLHSRTDSQVAIPWERY